MVLGARAVLYIFTLIITINCLHSTSAFRQNSLGILSEVIGPDSRSPLVVVIKSADQARSLDNEMVQGYSSSSESYNSYRNYKAAKLESANDIYNVLIQGDTNNMLRDGKNNIDNTEEQLDKEIMIANALRSRCQAIVECEEKCPKEEPKNECSESEDECDATTEKCSDSCEEKPKPEKYCPKSCKAVFDHLINCPPPGNEKNKKKENKKKKGCGPATGKTLPPNWTSC